MRSTSATLPFWRVTGNAAHEAIRLYFAPLRFLVNRLRNRLRTMRRRITNRMTPENTRYIAEIGAFCLDEVFGLDDPKRKEVRWLFQVERDLKRLMLIHEQAAADYLWADVSAPLKDNSGLSHQVKRDLVDREQKSLREIQHLLDQYRIQRQQREEIGGDLKGIEQLALELEIQRLCLETKRLEELRAQLAEEADSFQGELDRLLRQPQRSPKDS